MNKDDKQFITGLIKGLDVKMGGVETRLLKEIKINQSGISENKVLIQENQKGIGENRVIIQENQEGISENKVLIQENQVDIKANQKGIHNNGILIEKLSDFVASLAENLSPRMDRLESKLEEILVNTQNLPVFYATVKKHERKLAGLCK